MLRTVLLTGYNWSHISQLLIRLSIVTDIILLRDLLKMWQKGNRTWPIEFKSTCRPTPVLWITYNYVVSWNNPHTLCILYFNQCLFYFVWRKCHYLITIFLENKKVPLLLQISILIEDWDFAIEILSQNQPLHLKPAPTHYHSLCKVHNAIHCL